MYFYSIATMIVYIWTLNGLRRPAKMRTDGNTYSRCLLLFPFDAFQHGWVGIMVL